VQYIHYDRHPPVLPLIQARVAGVPIFLLAVSVSTAAALYEGGTFDPRLTEPSEISEKLGISLGFSPVESRLRLDQRRISTTEIALDRAETYAERSGDLLLAHAIDPVHPQAGLGSA
jgi:hypothetical protein